jgi:ribosomal protein L11 methyltransferase
MQFWQLTVATSEETSDGMTNFLWEHGALGVVEEETPSAPPTVRAFFPETASSTGLIASVTAYRESLRSLGFAVSPDEPQIAPLLDGDWASAWQQSFPPLAVGERLLVVPPWEARGGAAADARVEVIIEPGRAFGTGHHGSTAGCLALLELALSRRQAGAVLDIGTGTGILAIAALKLGAPLALGIDIDPDAIAAARANAAKNECADRLVATLEGPEALVDRPPVSLVLANLLTHTHLGLAPCYARLVAPGGLLVLGGILAGEGDRVRDAVAATGFAAEADLVVDGWASLLLSRRTDS